MVLQRKHTKIPFKLAQIAYVTTATTTAIKPIKSQLGTRQKGEQKRSRRKRRPT